MVGRGLKAFSLVELMVSAFLFAVITATALTIFSKLKRKEMEAQIQSELRSAILQAQSILEKDIQNTVRLTGDTATGTHFEATPTYGALRFPFEPSSGQASDGLQLFVLDSENSSDASYALVSAALNAAGGTDFVVKGDFRPFEERSEDLFAVRKGDRTELFSLVGEINTSGSGSNLTSSFQAAESFPNAWIPVNSGDAFSVFRVERRVYRIGDGSQEVTGLYRVRNNLTQLISSRVSSMRVEYSLVSREVASESDCATKDGTRFFPHAANSSECDWNDISSLNVELVGESNQEIGAETVHPHTQVEDGKVKVISSMVKTPADYSKDLTN